MRASVAQRGAPTLPPSRCGCVGCVGTYLRLARAHSLSAMLLLLLLQRHHVRDVNPVQMCVCVRACGTNAATVCVCVCVRM